MEENYEIMECIRKGEMAEIYKVRDRRDESIRALKIIRRLPDTRISAGFFDKWNLLKNLVCSTVEERSIGAPQVGTVP